MLGYFAIYSGRFSDRMQEQTGKPAPKRRWWHSFLPHEIAALNAR